MVNLITAAWISALRDWVDEDDEGFAENRYYSKQDPPYRSRNRAAQTWSELLYIPGFTRSLFHAKSRYEPADMFAADFMDCVTVGPVPRSGPVCVNINTAAATVLLGILGLEQEALVRHILMRRRQAAIQSIDELAPFAGDLNALKMSTAYLDTKSTLFRIDARAYHTGQAVQVMTIVQRSAQGEIDILHWVL